MGLLGLQYNCHSWVRALCAHPTTEDLACFSMSLLWTRKVKPKMNPKSVCLYLWFSTFLTVQPFNIVPHVLVTPNLNIILLLFYS